MRQKRIYQNLQYHETSKSCNLLLISSLLQCKKQCNSCFKKKTKLFCEKYCLFCVKTQKIKKADVALLTTIENVVFAGRSSLTRPARRRTLTSCWRSWTGWVSTSESVVRNSWLLSVIFAFIYTFIYISSHNKNCSVTFNLIYCLNSQNHYEHCCVQYFNKFGSKLITCIRIRPWIGTDSVVKKIRTES